MKENQIEEVNGQLLTIFNMIDKIEWETINIKAMNALKDGMWSNRADIVIVILAQVHRVYVYMCTRIYLLYCNIWLCCVFNCIPAGTAALNALHSEMSREDVELLLEESEEAREVR